jgi:hypothetical protein
MQHSQTPGPLPDSRAAVIFSPASPPLLVGVVTVNRSPMNSFTSAERRCQCYQPCYTTVSNTLYTGRSLQNSKPTFLRAITTECYSLPEHTLSFLYLRSHFQNTQRCHHSWQDLKAVVAQFQNSHCAAWVSPIFISVLSHSRESFIKSSYILCVYRVKFIWTSPFDLY